MIYILNYNEKVPENSKVISTTTKSKMWSRELSPMIVGPVDSPNGHAKNVENFWQFSKVYDIHTDNGKASGNITSEYYKWRDKGFKDSFAHRYPMGKGSVPLFSYLHGVGRLSYIDARKLMYLTYYKQCVETTDAYKQLEDVFNDTQKNNQNLVLLDYDAYNHIDLGYNYDDVLNNPYRKMGHAFVLAMMLDGFI